MLMINAAVAIYKLGNMKSAFASQKKMQHSQLLNPMLIIYSYIFFSSNSRKGLVK